MRHQIPAPPLRLASHVRACESDGQVILLDLLRSKYVGVPQSSALADRVQGWPGNQTSGHIPTCSSGASVLMQRLVEQGLLTGSPAARLPRTAVEQPTSSLDMRQGVPWPDISAREVGRFVHSAAMTALWLRCRSLQAIATAVETRRVRLRKNPPDPELEAVRRSVMVYERLRPFVFTAYQNCLYDSLALVGFLATHGLFPRWVIGVQTRPFAAHSWVQSGGMVLNDEHERVRRFRPILVV